MKKWVWVIAWLLVMCLQTAAMAELDLAAAQSPDFFEQYSVEDLLLLRELIDAELERRNYAPEEAMTYIVNTNTQKFHLATCSNINRMKEQNREVYTGERRELISLGFDPCGNCHP